MEYKEYNAPKTKNEQILLPKILRASRVTGRMDGNNHASTLHAHNFTELFFVKSGKCLFSMDGQLYHIEQGDVLIIRPKHEHGELPDKNSDVDLYILAVNEIRINVNKENFIQHRQNSFETTSFYFESIFEELKNGDRNSGICAQNLTENLFIHLIRKLSWTKDSEEYPTSGTLEETKQYIDKYFYKKISIAKLASTIFISPEHYIRLFKKLTGSTPLQYLNRKRLEESLAALSYTDKTIGSIAIDIGFSDVNNYIRKFKQIYGITPQQFRKQTELK